MKAPKLESVNPLTEQEFEPLLNLSPREIEIVALMGKGKATKEIANQLKLSIKTIESHRSHILDKTGLSGTIALYYAAIRCVIFCEQNRMKLVPVPITKPRHKLTFQPVK